MNAAYLTIPSPILDEAITAYSEKDDIKIFFFFLELFFFLGLSQVAQSLKK
jgi:hypothetical protein